MLVTVSLTAEGFVDTTESAGSSIRTPERRIGTLDSSTKHVAGADDSATLGDASAGGSCVTVGMVVCDGVCASTASTPVVCTGAAVPDSGPAFGTLEQHPILSFRTAVMHDAVARSASRAVEHQARYPYHYREDYQIIAVALYTYHYSYTWYINNCSRSHIYAEVYVIYEQYTILTRTVTGYE